MDDGNTRDAQTNSITPGFEDKAQFPLLIRYNDESCTRANVVTSSHTQNAFIAVS